MRSNAGFVLTGTESVLADSATEDDRVVSRCARVSQRPEDPRMGATVYPLLAASSPHLPYLDVNGRRL